MVVQGFENSLDSLRGRTVRTSNPKWTPEPGIAPVELQFSDGARVLTSYWRIIRNGKSYLSSFDHQQEYGLPEAIDAFARIAEVLDGTTLREARWDARTGDVFFFFEPDLELQVFSFTGYEDWEMHFSNGIAEYSPYAH